MIILFLRSEQKIPPLLKVIISLALSQCMNRTLLLSFSDNSNLEVIKYWIVYIRLECDNRPVINHLFVLSALVRSRFLLIAALWISKLLLTA